jgi:protocatechuate 3,4-dioxygenase beta subunit
MKLPLTLILIIVCVFNAHAISISENVIKSECEVTPQVWQLIKWPKIQTTNNLRRKTGRSLIAHGEKLVVEGKVVDSNCVPVVGAIVEIWQANAFGKLENQKLIKDGKHDENFSHTGKAITDNLGNFQFLTVNPGVIKGRAPFINFRIKHRDFGITETVMFFENQSANDYDPILTNEVKSNKQDLLVAKAKNSNNDESGEGVVYRFDITLEGKNKYLNY